jgi:hypothetical protein
MRVTGWSIGPALSAPRREPIDQRQPIKALAESPSEIVDPALPTQSAPMPDLLHRQAQD